MVETTHYFPANLCAVLPVQQPTPVLSSLGSIWPPLVQSMNLETCRDSFHADDMPNWGDTVSGPGHSLSDISGQGLFETDTRLFCFGEGGLVAIFEIACPPEEGILHFIGT